MRSDKCINLSWFQKKKSVNLPRTCYCCYSEQTHSRVCCPSLLFVLWTWCLHSCWKKKVCVTITIVFIHSLFNQDIWNISLRESTLKYILRLSSKCNVDLGSHLSRCYRHLSRCYSHLSRCYKHLSRCYNHLLEWFSEILKKKISDNFSWSIFYITFVSNTESFTVG